MYKPKLYVMVGLSGSGKSTLAKQLTDAEKNTIIISSDSIREELTGKVEDQSKNEEVFKIFHKRIREGLENKHNVVADATNNWINKFENFRSRSQKRASTNVLYIYSIQRID